MSEFLNHPEFYDRPICLTEEERSDPLKIISCFFDDFRLSEIRDRNRQMDHVCLSTDMDPFDDPDERDRLLWYRRNEERLLEAAFLLSQNYDPAAKSLLLENPTPKVPHHLIGQIDLTDLQKRLVDIQYKLAQVCNVVANAYSVGVDKLAKP